MVFVNSLLSWIHFFSALIFLLELHFFIHCHHHWTISNFTQGGYRGFYSKNTITLTPKVVNDIHKRGGTILGTSRGGHDTGKIVDSIQDRGINQVYCVKFILQKFPMILNAGIIILQSIILMHLTWVGYCHDMDFLCLG